MEKEERKVAAGVSFSLTLSLQAGDLVLSSLCKPPHPHPLPAIQLSVSITVA